MKDRKCLTRSGWDIAGDMAGSQFGLIGRFNGRLWMGFAFRLCVLAMKQAPQADYSLPVRAALALIAAYKRVLSPLVHLSGARCRHLPGCSDYAADAFRMHGGWRGFWLAISRLSRCHPFGSHGFDPPPQTLPDRGLAFWRYGDWAWTERRVRPHHACDGGACGAGANAEESSPARPDRR